MDMQGLGSGVPVQMRAELLTLEPEAVTHTAVASGLEAFPSPACG